MEPVKRQHRRNPVTAIGRWSARHPWQAIAVWLAFVVAALGASALTGTKTLQSGTVGESARGYSMLEQTRPGRRTSSTTGIVHSGSLTAGDPAFRAAVSDVRARMRAVLGTERQRQRLARRRTPRFSPRTPPRTSGALQDSLAAAAAAHRGLTIGGDGPGSSGATARATSGGPSSSRCR